VLIHVIAANGNYRLPLTVPPAVGGFSLHFQAGAIDPGAVQGFSMSDGLVMPIL
jgi:hypothetical protein